MKILPLTQQDTQENSEAYAAAVSFGMWSLCSHPSSSTVQMYPIVTHPSTGQFALKMGGEQFYVQPTADPGYLLNLVSGVLSASELEGLRDDIEAARGSRVDVLNLLPDQVVSNVITEEEAEEQGWLA